MLKRSERLGRSQFASYAKGGRRFHSENMTVVYHPSLDFHGAVVVGKKVSKLAVTRNTIRRRVYAVLYGLKARQKSGVYIVMIKPSYKNLTKQAARSEVEALIGRIHKTA